jgi:hypothetical protein
VRQPKWQEDKLFNLQRVVLKKEKELEAVARHLGPDTYLKRSKGIYEALTSKEENLREKIEKEKPKTNMTAPASMIASLQTHDRGKKTKTYRPVFLLTTPTNLWG